MENKEKQVISKKRVADHGEVLTARREVDAMLDLVKQETAVEGSVGNLTSYIIARLRNRKFSDRDIGTETCSYRAQTCTTGKTP